MIINNRELSWLTFNDRVLQEAQDMNVPLLERLRFLGIFSNNHDQFVKVRVANVVRQARTKGKLSVKNTDNFLPKELLQKINEHTKNAQSIFIDTYYNVLSEMEKQGIYVVNETQLNNKQIKFCREYFSNIISPRLVLLIIRKSIQLPFLKDDNVYHAVKMSSGKTDGNKYAIIQIPVSSACPRFVVLPSKKNKNKIIFIDDIIRLCLDEIFFMFSYKEISAYAFKIMRDAQLTFNDDISKSIIDKMKEGLEDRLHGQPIRLIYDKEMPQDLFSIIATKLKLADSKYLEAGDRYHMLKDLMRFPKVRPSLEYCNPTPLTHPDIKPFSSILKVIEKKDILLNYPYHTFNHFLDFLREAAIDPKVKSIYITLYRTAERSKVIRTLINAAKNGKEVVVLVELTARFDEEQNIESTDMLQKRGVKVIHGINGIKVHSKLVLVERKEGSATKGYAYIGTGNFNESSAQIYSDLGLFTANQHIVNDARAIFDFFRNTHKRFVCKKLLVSPYHMRSQLKDLIDQEISNARRNKPASICAKLNNLTDETMIKHLYKASQAGVKIRLIVRSACCLQPQVKGLSENIEVISIVDKYLEHSRLAIFHNNGKEQVYIMSADWMPRNLDRRVEVGTPIFDDKIRQTIKDIFEIQWADNVKARNLTVFGNNNYVHREYNTKIRRSQTELYEYYRLKTEIKK
ncbi:MULTISPECIES: polyphosphate kinase 1 [unclassified Dysgonomonas]|uniref:polyphosphate kinase 1 n=1 Tax=unclassified Dysgonomonas TaxID=2630389 RepID=UPI0024733BF1|nr:MULTISPECIES: polyphosphate kinase 1 [unclassified Dysgonomonas]